MIENKCMVLCVELFVQGNFYLNSRILKPNVEGHLLSLLIDNSTNRFQLSNVRLRESIDEKNLQTKK